MIELKLINISVLVYQSWYEELKCEERLHLLRLITSDSYWIERSQCRELTSVLRV